ncbi:hypothetical protein [Aminobacter carboxidus]|uniref:Uncharacterized protein n=1 Tax=Aminobacter carboxidus TaxID=376165 RepID=A0ABR9GXZ5_9HYPH|nr:hypothetical protein [Aminobacter carboxidus]MBE1208399.1 hypothetical protein [Aminobacter carboxidus]
MSWKNPYEIIDTVPIVPAGKPIVTFSSVKIDGEILYLLSHELERTKDLITPADVKNLSAFLIEAIDKIDAEQPTSYGLGLLGRIGRDFGRLLDCYHGYHIRAAYMLRNVSGVEVADFCIAHEDGDDRYRLVMFYWHAEAVCKYALGQEQITRWCAFIEREHHQP